MVLTDEHRQVIQSRRRSGVLWKHIAKEIGWDRHWKQLVRSAYGRGWVAERWNSFRHKDVRRGAAAMMGRGYSSEQIATHFQVSLATVWRWRKKLGRPSVRNRERDSELQQINQRVEAAKRGWTGAMGQRQCDVLDCLRDGPKVFDEIVAAIGYGQRKRRRPRSLSKMLKSLRDAGLVESERQGKFVVYRVRQLP